MSLVRCPHGVARTNTSSPDAPKGSISPMHAETRIRKSTKYGIRVKRAMRDFAAKELDGHLYVMAQHTFETDSDPQPSKPPAITAAHAGQLETVLVGALIAAAAQTLQYVVPAICVTGAIASRSCRWVCRS